MQVTILGAGFCGSMLCVRLLRETSENTKIILADKTAKFGTGIAYHPPTDDLLLNVTAELMGAVPDEPGHFFAWLQKTGLNFRGSDYVPRAVYGRYLKQLLDEAQNQFPGRVELLGEEAIAISETDSALNVKFSGARDVTSDAVVLALGNVPRKTSDPGDLPGVTTNPWHDWSWQQNSPDKSTLVIGSGLTALDVVLTLLRRGQRAPITLVSRHGLWPLPHPENYLPKPRDASVFENLHSTRKLMRAIREQASSAMSWEEVVDSLRPNAAGIWQSLPDKEKRRFLRHVASYWQIHRHRMPPQLGAEIRRAADSGLVKLLAGRMASLTSLGGNLEVSILPRGQHAAKKFNFDRVIDCRGSPDAPKLMDSPLMAALVERGLVMENPARAGVMTEADGFRLKRPDGSAGRIYGLGQITKGEKRWEITAVRELRAAAAELAQLLASDLQAARRSE